MFHISNKWTGHKDFLEIAVADAEFIWLKTDISV